MTLLILLRNLAKTSHFYNVRLKTHLQIYVDYVDFGGNADEFSEESLEAISELAGDHQTDNDFSMFESDIDSMPSLEEANDGEQEELDPEKQAKIAKAAAILEKMF